MDPMHCTYGLYILSGQGSLHTGEDAIAIHPGDQFFIPADCQAYTLCPETAITAFCCFGPTA